MTGTTMAAALLHNEADAEEVAQEAFLKAFRNLVSGRCKLQHLAARDHAEREPQPPAAQGAGAMESFDGTVDEPATVSPALLREWRSHRCGTRSPGD